MDRASRAGKRWLFIGRKQSTGLSRGRQTRDFVMNRLPPWRDTFNEGEGTAVSNIRQVRGLGFRIFPILLEYIGDDFLLMSLNTGVPDVLCAGSADFVGYDAIGFRVNGGEQIRPEPIKSVCLQPALKYGVLHTDPVVLADLGDLSQSAVLGDIVGNYSQHVFFSATMSPPFAGCGVIRKRLLPPALGDLRSRCRVLVWLIRLRRCLVGHNGDALLWKEIAESLAQRTGLVLCLPRAVVCVAMSFLSAIPFTP